MKKRINLICALILVVIFLSTAWNLYFTGYAVGEGFSLGFEAGKTDTPILNMSSTLSFTPSKEKYLLPTDTIATADGGKVPVIISSASVELPQGAPVRGGIIMDVAKVLFMLLYVVLVIRAICLFWKFTMNVKRDLIFDHKNTRLLSHTGWALIVCFFICIVNGLLQEFEVAGIPLSFDGYSYSAYWTIPWELAIMGLVGLLSAQIWKKAIKMKEEQELTI